MCRWSPAACWSCLFSLERIVLRLAGAPIDDILDELPPAEVAAELDTANVKV